MKNQVNISNLTPEQIEDLKQQLKALEEQPKSIMDKVKSWEDAAKIAINKDGYFINTNSYVVSTYGLAPFVNKNKNVVPSEKHAKSILAACQLMVIAEALNEGWKPDFENMSPKYTIVAYLNKEIKIGVNICDVQCQFYFKSKELAEYAMTRFEDLWYDYFMIDKPE